MEPANPIKRRSARLSALQRRKSTEQPVKKEKTVAMAEDTGGEIEMDTALTGAWSEHQTSEKSYTIEPLSIDLLHYVDMTPPSHENSGEYNGDIEVENSGTRCFYIEIDISQIFLDSVIKSRR